MSVTDDEVRKCLKQAKHIKKRMPPGKEIKAMADRMKLLAHPTRLKILKILSQESVCVCVLTELTGKSQPNISQHLAKLKDNGVIEDYSVGKLVFYRMRDRKMPELIRSLGSP